MAALFLQYLLPVLALALLCGGVVLRLRWNGGPLLLFLVFGVIAFGPSLLYALLANNSSGALFGCSVLAALAAVGSLAFARRKKP